MTLSVLAVVRATVVAGLGAGLVVAATRIPGAVAVGSTRPADLAVTANSAAVTGSALTCPGPELVGVPGIRDLPVGVRAAAAAAPSEALPGVHPVTTAGGVSLTGMPGAELGPPGTTRGPLTAATVAGASGVLASGTQSLAPGLAASQSWLVSKGDQRALGSTACTAPGSDLWLLAGGGGPGRQERLVLTNPGGNPVTVDLTLFGPTGPVSSSIGKGLVVPAHGRVAFLLDSISDTVVSPAVHVVTDGGLVGAVVNDSWLNGTTSAGSDDAGPSAPPAREQVIPGVEVSGPAVLRVVVPGPDEAVVQARVLTRQGARPLPSGGVVRVPGGTVRDIDISGVPGGPSAVQVRADVPVLASVVFARSTPKSADFAWAVSTPPITGVAGIPFADLAPTYHAVDLTATGSPVDAEVVSVDQGGTARSQHVRVPADASATVLLPASGSVWVVRTSGGQLRAAVNSWFSDSLGTLVTSTPLRDAPLRTTAVTVRPAQP